MSIQLINIGNVVNDGLGDDLRTAFEKVNANFADVAENVLSAGRNLGEGAQLFKGKDVSTFEFRTITGGTGIGVNQFEDTIQISSTIRQAFKSIETNAGTLTADAFEDFKLKGGESTDIVYDGAETITVDTVKIDNRSFTDILTSYDFGPITGVYNNAVQFAIANSNIDFGTIDSPTAVNLDGGQIEIQGLL